MYNLLRKGIGYDSDLPSVEKTNKNSILNFARVGDAISFCRYDYLCKTEPQKQLIKV